MAKLKYLLSNLWDLIRLGRFRTPREKVLDHYKKKYGVTSIEVVPAKKKPIMPKTSSKYRKAPKVKLREKEPEPRFKIRKLHT